jgi:hypothetical protein
MSMTMGGAWLLRVDEKKAQFSQRFIVSGANRGNGIYAERLGLAVSVDGPSWLIDFEWNDDDRSGWEKSRCKKLDAKFSFSSGLVIKIGADDNFLHLADDDFDDLVLVCECQDPTINGPAFVNPYDFSLKRRRG